MTDWEDQTTHYIWGELGWCSSDLMQFPWHPPTIVAKKCGLILLRTVAWGRRGSCLSRHWFSELKWPQQEVTCITSEHTLGLIHAECQSHIKKSLLFWFRKIPWKKEVRSLSWEELNWGIFKMSLPKATVQMQGKWVGLKEPQPS